MYCTYCGKECETYIEDRSFDYSGTHCTFGNNGTHIEYGDELSVCCDVEVVEYLDEE